MKKISWVDRDGVDDTGKIRLEVGLDGGREYRKRNWELGGHLRGHVET